MLSRRKTAVTVGLLFLIATATYLTADTIVRTALSGPDLLIAATSEATALRTAALLALVCGIAGIAMALLMYPLFQPHSERLALGYVAFRVGELGPIILFAVTPLLLVALGAGSPAGGVDASEVSLLGLLLRSLHSVSFQILSLLVGASGIIFSYLLYRTKLVPRSIAALGLIGYSLLIVGMILYIFELIDLLEGTGLVFAWVVGLFEVILPVWLIAKGFDTRPTGTFDPATPGQPLP